MAEAYNPYSVDDGYKDEEVAMAEWKLIILNDNHFFLHNPMSFNWFIFMSILESTI